MVQNQNHNFPWNRCGETQNNSFHANGGFRQADGVYHGREVNKKCSCQKPPQQNYCCGCADCNNNCTCNVDGGVF